MEVFFYAIILIIHIISYLSIRHPAQVVGRDVSFLSVGLSQPPVFVAYQV